MGRDAASLPERSAPPLLGEGVLMIGTLTGNSRRRAQRFVPRRTSRALPSGGNC